MCTADIDIQDPRYEPSVWPTVFIIVWGGKGDLVPYLRRVVAVWLESGVGFLPGTEEKLVVRCEKNCRLYAWGDNGWLGGDGGNMNWNTEKGNNFQTKQSTCHRNISNMKMYVYLIYIFFKLKFDYLRLYFVYIEDKFLKKVDLLHTKLRNTISMFLTFRNEC